MDSNAIVNNPDGGDGVRNRQQQQQKSSVSNGGMQSKADKEEATLSSIPTSSSTPSSTSVTHQQQIPQLPQSTQHDSILYASKKSIDQRVWVALAYHEEKNAAAVIKRFKLEFPNEKPPTEEAVKRIYEKLVAPDSVLDQYNHNACRPSTGISDENVAVLGQFDSPIFNHNLLLILTWTVIFLLMAMKLVK